MMKTALVGCGKIAEQHLNALKLVSNAQVTALCDSEGLMTEQLAERHKIQSRYTGLGEMIEKASPQVVHITTPPSSHYKLAMQCLEAGCHIYVEKPFTLNEKEAQEILIFAEKQNRLVTAGYNLQFSDEALEMRKLVNRDYLGSRPVHLEVIQGYSLDDPYAKAFLSDPGHWLRSLPGGLLQNLICHGIAKIAEFLPEEEVRVQVLGFQSPRLRASGEENIVDELRVVLSADPGITAFYTFTSRIGAARNQMRLYGEKNALIVDQNHRIVIPLPGKSYKAQLNYILPPRSIGKSYRRKAISNLKRFLNGSLRLDSGMVSLMKAFYDSAESGGAPPLPYNQILSISHITDKIFEQLNNQYM